MNERETKREAGRMPAVQIRHQDGRTCAGGTGSRRFSSVVRFVLVVLLPVVMALVVLVAKSMFDLRF
jgi:hypothetical protein